MHTIPETNAAPVADSVFHTLRGDRPYKVTPAKLSPLQDAFQKAGAMGHALLIHVSYIEEDLSAHLGAPHDSIGLGDYRTYEAFISLKQDTVPQAALREVFRKDGKILGLYDLTKPFDAAHGGKDLLPAPVDAAIRDIVFERQQPDLTLWQKIMGHKAAYKASLAIYQP